MIRTLQHQQSRCEADQRLSSPERKKEGPIKVGEWQPGWTEFGSDPTSTYPASPGFGVHAMFTK